MTNWREEQFTLVHACLCWRGRNYLANFPANMYNFVIEIFLCRRSYNKSIDPRNMTDSIIEDLIYAVAYAETMTQEAFEEKRKMKSNASDYKSHRTEWKKKYAHVFNHANSFLDRFIRCRIPGLHLLLNREEIKADYYEPKQIRRS